MKKPKPPKLKTTEKRIGAREAAIRGRALLKKLSKQAGPLTPSIFRDPIFLHYFANAVLRALELYGKIPPVPTWKIDPEFLKHIPTPGKPQ